MTKKVLAIVSGGLDSTTMMYDLMREGWEVETISFNYGQRHNKELIYASANARMLHLEHEIVDIKSITRFISNSVLTSDTDVPEGHYAEDNMKATVVPNRNMIMLSIAAGVAVNRGFDAIATGVHSGDHFIYPDCRPRFIAYANAAIVIGNEGFGNIPPAEEGTELPAFILTPYLHSSKEEIAYKALELGVPLHLTWSCYKGEDTHCGRCGTCVERLEAIDAALLHYNERHSTPKMDATTYQDIEFWKTATRDYATDGV